MRTPTIVSICITAAALAAGAARLLWPTLTIDSVTVALIVIAVVPWLAPIFKSLEIPGGFKVEWQNQGTTANPPRPQSDVSSPKELTTDARKVLATLWQHQRFHFKDDYSKRWTFAVTPGSVSFPSYLRGVAELVGSGLASVVPETWHCVLTDPGIQYCRKDGSLDTATDTYRF
jgi:hypothetical protein